MVRIQYACLENWNEMRPVQGGRMCDRCAHKVVDYSQTSGPVQTDGGCGRFRLDQVESVRRTLRASQWAGWSMGLLAFLGLLDGSEAAAQTEVQPVEGAVPERNAVGRLRIHGHVVTAEGHALEARFEVYRKGELVRSLKTDLDGRFDLILDTMAYHLTDLEVRFIAPEGLESSVGPEGLEVALEAGEMVVELELVHEPFQKLSKGMLPVSDITAGEVAPAQNQIPAMGADNEGAQLGDSLALNSSDTLNRADSYVLLDTVECITDPPLIYGTGQTRTSTAWVVSGDIQVVQGDKEEEAVNNKSLSPRGIDPFTSGSRFSGKEIERFGRR